MLCNWIEFILFFCILMDFTYKEWSWKYYCTVCIQYDPWNIWLGADYCYTMLVVSILSKSLEV